MIRLEAVGKRYWQLQERAMLLRSLLPFGRPTRSELWALRDVNLALAEGDVLGVIGPNGAGKTTLLRLLAGVTRPTTGRVAVAGRVAPLISVGVGFHREMSGRENVYVNGIVLGRTRREMDERFDDIVAFSELAHFVDTPVKFYSSGMLVRLGFAASIMVEPDVLIVDEVLAVGDLAFQLKCFDRMAQLREGGTTIVLVTHSMRAVQRLCDRTLVLHDGQIRHDGDTNEAVGVYHDVLGETRDLVEEGQYFEGRTVDPRVAVEEFELLGPDGEPSRHLTTGDDMTARLRVRFVRETVDPIAVLNVTAEGGVLVYATTTPWTGAGRYAEGARAEFTARFQARLVPGSYTARVGLMTADNSLLTPKGRPLLFYVNGPPGTKGFADLGAEFVVSSPPADGGRAAREGPPHM